MKWLAVTVIIILAVGTVGGGYLYLQETNKLKDAQSEIVALEGNVATLEGNVSSLEGNVSALEGNVSALETNLADSEATVSTLETDLEATNAEIDGLQADVSTQQNINSALSAELKTVKDPRHFASLQELTDWLNEDDTDTKYKDESMSEKAFILQVRALRDGYLLPAVTSIDGEGANLAVIGDEEYAVNPNDDDTEFMYYVEPVSSHPLPLD